MDHTQAPILDALDEFHAAEHLPFTPPGHKRGRGTSRRTTDALGRDVPRSDVLASGGLDDRLTRGRVLERAEVLMADAVHAEHTFFSTCGSSLSVKAAILSVAEPHEKLLIGRDAHKSVVAGLILSGIRPVWIEPQWDRNRHLAHPPSAAAFAEAFEEHPDARGALVTSPTPYGSCADLAAIARVCHGHARPLVVDEAWGAHLPFHPSLPAWAMDAGADVCVTSVHKMGSGLEQGSVFHLRGELIDPMALKLRADILGTTSPSVLILAGLDGWRRQMALEGEELLGAALREADTLHTAVQATDGLHLNGRADLTGGGLAADLDPLPTVIDISELGTTGYRVADEMRTRHGMDLHLADHRRVAAQLTFADDEGTTAPLLEALRQLVDRADELRPAPTVEVPSPEELRLSQVTLPRDAFFASVEDTPRERAAGRVAAEMLTPYPPGIPVALPGERLTEPVLRYLSTGVEAGMNIPDAVDPLLRTVRTVAER